MCPQPRTQGCCRTAVGSTPTALRMCVTRAPECAPDAPQSRAHLNGVVPYISSYSKMPKLHQSTGDEWPAALMTCGDGESSSSSSSSKICSRCLPVVGRTRTAAGSSQLLPRHLRGLPCCKQPPARPGQQSPGGEASLASSHLWGQVLLRAHKAVGTRNGLGKQQQLITVGGLAWGRPRVLQPTKTSSSMSGAHSKACTSLEPHRETHAEALKTAGKKLQAPAPPLAKDMVLHGESVTSVGVLPDVSCRVCDPSSLGPCPMTALTCALVQLLLVLRRWEHAALVACMRGCVVPRA